MKACSTCKVVKALSEFNRNATKPDGLQPRCKACRREHYLADPTPAKARACRVRLADRAKYLEGLRLYREAHRQKLAAAARLRYSLKREEIKAKMRARHAANPARAKADKLKRVFAEQRRIPLWADRGAIAAVYAKAAEIKRDIGVDVHVDHVIPLRGKRVSGLHVANNLRIVTAEENRGKYNTLIEELV